MQRPSVSEGRRTGFRWQLILAPLALFAALVSWAVASPVGASPDDDFHLASIWCGLGERPGLCEPGDTPDARTVPKALLTASQGFAYRQDDSAACELPPADEMVSSTRGNFTGTYPPVFYAAMGVMASDDIPTSVIWMRIVNAGLFVGLVSLLTWLVPTGLRKLALWPVMLTIVPLGMFIDGLSLLLILAPLFHPIVTEFGYDEIWFGILFIKTIEIGLLTPPVGLNVFVVSGLFKDLRVEDVFRRITPFILMEFVVTALLFSFPDIITILPRMAGVH